MVHSCFEGLNNPAASDNSMSAPKKQSSPRKKYLGGFMACYARDNEHSPLQQPNRTGLPESPFFKWGLSQEFR
jgi:hypothetical protein